MKIIDGIQLTGRGHRARERILVAKFRDAGADVTCHFSGPAPKDMAELDIFKPYKLNTGFTFATRNGTIDHLQSAFDVHGRTFIRDVKRLYLKPYDAILVDYEPVLAHAAMLRRRETIGIGNQYSFLYDIPRDRKHPFSSALLNHFAPVTHPLGIHWHHFGQPILPPITNPPAPGEIDPKKVLVYMGFENVEDVVAFLEPHKDYEFYIYMTAIEQASNEGNIHLRPLGDSFRDDMATCGRVICNAGFETPTEVMSMGKPVLVRPLEHQMEQAANAVALEKLKLENVTYGDAMFGFDPDKLRAWLDKGECVRITYPDVAASVVEWVMNGDYKNPSLMAQDLWHRTKVEIVDAPRPRIKRDI